MLRSQVQGRRAALVKGARREQESGAREGEEKERDNNLHSSLGYKEGNELVGKKES